MERIMFEQALKKDKGDKTYTAVGVPPVLIAATIYMFHKYLARQVSFNKQIPSVKTKVWESLTVSY